MDLSSVVEKPMRGGLSFERPRLEGRTPRRGRKAERGSAVGVG
jgi:hypothetical protein